MTPPWDGLPLPELGLATAEELLAADVKGARLSHVGGRPATECFAGREPPVCPPALRPLEKRFILRGGAGAFAAASPRSDSRSASPLTWISHSSNVSMPSAPPAAATDPTANIEGWVSASLIAPAAAVPFAAL